MTAHAICLTKLAVHRGRFKTRNMVRNDVITVDPNNGQVIDRVDFTDWPFMAKLTTWTIAAHMGLLFGLVNQLVLAALAIGLILVIYRATACGGFAGP